MVEEKSEVKTENASADATEDMKSADTAGDLKTEGSTENATGDLKTEDSTENATGDLKTEEEDMKTEDATTEDLKSEDKKPEENGSEKPKPTLLEMKIIRQVEYYFGNVNLWRDKFLKEKRKEDDGWVTIECLTTFNRLQALSMDFEEIVTALEKSKTGLLEIHKDRRKIRRSLSKPLPDQDDPMLRKASKMKTLYIKGFPTSYTLDDVQDFILSQECQNIFIKMKQDQDKAFKGSVIVEMSTLEEANKFLNNEMKLGHDVLTVMRRDDYFLQKNDKGRLNKDGGNQNENDDDKKPPPKLGCVLHFKGASEETSREDLKELFGAHEEVEWVDFSRGETQGYVRFKNEGGALKAIDAVKAANDDKIKIKDVECEVRVIEGIEEKNYWILANEDKKRPRFQSNRGRRNKKDRGQEGWRKRRRPWEHSSKTGNTEEKPKNQHKKFDDNDAKTETKDSSETVEKKAKVAVET